MITAQDGTRFYTRKDIVKTFKMGDKKSLELFHDPSFPAQKFGRSWYVSVDAFNEFIKNRHVYTNTVY